MTGSSSGGGRLTLAAMIFMVGMTMIDMTIVSIAAPMIQRDLHLSSTGIQWMVTGYLVALAAAFALGGRLADVIGPRTMVMVGAVIFIASSVLCGLTPDGSAAETWMISFRVVQGIGAALMFPAALAIVMRAFPIERRGGAVAAFFGIAGFLTSLGPIAGGYLTEWSWRAIFWINVPVAAIGIVLTLMAKVDNPRVREPIDWPGALLIAAGMGCSVTGLQEASSWGWGDTRTLAFIIGGAILIGAFFEFERHRSHPLIRVSFFSIRTFTAQNLVLLFASAAFVPVFFFASMYAQISLGWSTSNAGLYTMMFFLGFAPGVQVGGRLLDKGRARTAVVWGALIASAGFFAWAARLTTLTENAQWPWIVLAGAGLGLLIGSANTDAVNQVPAENFGEATGVTQTSRNYGASLGIAVFGTILTTAFHSRVESSLATLGISTAQADQVAAAMQGSGGGSPSDAFAALGSNADAAYQLIRSDFAEASQYAFRGMGVAMALAAITAVVGLARTHRSGAAGDAEATPAADPTEATVN